MLAEVEPLEAGCVQMKTAECDVDCSSAQRWRRRGATVIAGAVAALGLRRRGARSHAPRRSGVLSARAASAACFAQDARARAERATRVRVTDSYFFCSEAAKHPKP